MVPHDPFSLFHLPTPVLGNIINFLCPPRICVSFDLSTSFASDVDKNSGFSLGGPIVLQFKRNQTLKLQPKNNKNNNNNNDDDTSDDNKSEKKQKTEKIVMKAKPPGGPEFLAEEERQKIIKEKEAGGAKFLVRFTDRSNEIRSWSSTVAIASSSSFSDELEDSSSSQCAHKAVLLQQYVRAIKNFLTSISGKSVDQITPAQIDRLKAFKLWFERQIAVLHKNDLTKGKEIESLKPEIALIDQLLGKIKPADSRK